MSNHSNAAKNERKVHMLYECGEKKNLPLVNTTTMVRNVTILGGLINVWGGMSCNRQNIFESKDSWKQYKLRQDAHSCLSVTPLLIWRRIKVPIIWVDLDSCCTEDVSQLCIHGECNTPGLYETSVRPYLLLTDNIATFIWTMIDFIQSLPEIPDLQSG